MMNPRARWAGAVAMLLACGPQSDADPLPSDAASTSDGGETEDAPSPPGDPATTATTDDDPPADSSGDAPPPATTGEPEPGGASIAGSVTRTAMPTAGGQGTVYIAVFDGDPIVGQPNALGQAVLSDVDMSTDGTVLTYQIDGLPEDVDPLFVVAFLDDNGTADPAMPGPDMGDLVSLQGAGVPSFSLDGAGVTAVNLVLNTVMPF